jgi:hypothetical protein
VPATPPDTGASTYATPVSTSAVATLRAASRPIVDVSTTWVVRRSPTAMMALPTCAYAAPSGRLRITTSARWDTSATSSM